MSDIRDVVPSSSHGPGAFAESVRRLHAHQPALPLPGRGDTLGRWRSLAAIAAQDVCVAKVLEAHHDAVAILDDLAAPPGQTGPLHAVWAAEPPDARLEFIEDGDGHGRLQGTKAWCSGADIVEAALVTAHAGTSRVLVQVVLDQPAITRATDDWHAVGMARVHSGRVHFDGATGLRIGAPGAYLERPGFWHGGAGIAACWFGATAAIAETLRTHPRVSRDAHAAAHLGAIDVQLAAAAALLQQTASAIDAQPDAPHVDAVMRVRSLIERVATDVVDRVGRALGPGPLCEDAAHAHRCADLTTFVRQSHAERDWAVLGEAAGARAHGWVL